MVIIVTWVALFSILAVLSFFTGVLLERPTYSVFKPCGDKRSVKSQKAL